MKAYEQQRDEPQDAFEAFVLYCELGEKRSVAKVRQEFGEPISKSKVEHWCKIFNWVTRSAVFDADLVAPLEAWEQQKNERGLAYAAFGTYRDMGRLRSLRSLSEQTGKCRRLLERWSTQHKWQERVLAFDRAEDRARQIRNRNQVNEWFDREVKIAGTLQNKMVQRLVGDEPNQVEALDLNKLSFVDCLKGLETARGLALSALGAGEIEETAEELEDQREGRVIVQGISEDDL